MSMTTLGEVAMANMTSTPSSHDLRQHDVPLAKKKKDMTKVTAASLLGKRKLADSDAIQATHLARRLVKPVLVTGVTDAVEVTIIQPSEFKTLNVDERYQRVRIGDEVNSLIHVLKSGGSIPDPIDIAERRDGSRWIVDGQQRFWAHDEVKVPLKALIHKVDSLDAEVNLFVALNSRRKLTPKAVLKGWPGLSGQFIRRIATSEKSPVRGMVDLLNNSKLPLDGPSLLRSVLVVTTGTKPGGDMVTQTLPRTDAALAVPGMIAWAEAFVELVAAVFGMQAGAGRVRVLPLIALANVAHRKFKAAGRPTFPKSCARLRKLNWDTIAPTHAEQFLPLLEREVERRWK